jgi:hypothetical protein
MLKPGGSLIITVPSRSVDTILDILIFFRIIDGMSTHEHYGFSPKETIVLGREAGFTLVKSRTFQLGLNNIFVFKK